MGLYRRKDSPLWWMSFRLKGRRLRESTGTDNRRLAEKIHAKKTLEVADGRFFEAGAEASMSRTLDELIERYQSQAQFKKRWPSRDVSIFNHLRAFFGEGATLDELEAKIDGYENFRRGKAAPATIVKELGLLRRMCNLAMRWRWLKSNPVALVELPRVSNDRVRYLQPEELQKLTVALPAWMRPIVALARSTGLRRENILSLTWPQVDLLAGFLSLPVTKNGEPLYVPMNKTATKAIEGLARLRRLGCPWVLCNAEGRRYTGDQVSMAFRRACKKARVEGLRFHDLRHDFASRLVQRGVDIYRVKGLLGHKDLRMTARYAHLAPENLEAVRILDDPAQMNFMDDAGHDLVTLQKTKGA